MSAGKSDQIIFEEGEFSDDPDSWLPFSACQAARDVTEEEDRVTLSSEEEDSPYSLVLYGGAFEEEIGRCDMVVDGVDPHTGRVALVMADGSALGSLSDVRRIVLYAVWPLCTFRVRDRDFSGGQLCVARDGFYLHVGAVSRTSAIWRDVHVCGDAEKLRFPLEDANPYQTYL